jgi:LacI family transcriptional regulator
MKDIAKAAAVSVATVSNVLSGKKYVSPEVKERVESVIRKMDYKPSHIARSLKNHRTFQIGVMVPDITNPYFAEIIRGVESVTLKNNFQLFLCNTDGESFREELSISSFLKYRVDGIIDVAPRMNEEMLKKGFSETPLVIVDREISFTSPWMDVVYTNNYKASAQLAKHFLEKGYRRLACLAGPFSVPSARQRLNGFIHYLNEHGIPDSDITVRHGEFKFESGFYMMRELLKETGYPRAVFACNDLMAWGALEAIKENGLAIPSDISIAGFDNVYFSRFVVPALTTVHQKKYEAGQIATELLLEKIRQAECQAFTATKQIELDTELIIRESA